MGTITSNFSTTLDGVTTIGVGDDNCVWNERKQLYDVVDIVADLEGPTLTASLTLSSKAWVANVVRTSHTVNAVVKDQTTGATDEDRASIGALIVNGFGTNTVTLKHAEVDMLAGGEGKEKVTVGYWIGQMNLNHGDDEVSLVGSGAAGDISFGRGNDLLKTASGRVGTVDGARGSDTVLLGKGGADYINLGRDADKVKLSLLADKLQHVVLNGGEGTSSATEKDSDIVDFSAFSAALTIDLNDQHAVKTGSGNFHIRNFENVVGGSGKDVIVASNDVNIFTGGSGADRFVFKTVKAAAGDTILDFSQAQKDKIDLSAMDASNKSKGDQDFDFIGAAKFSKTAGELRFEKKGGDTLIHGDVNGDGKADFSILVDASISFKAGDFLL